MKVVFFGTPDFAVATLEAIHKSGVGVVAVVTAPDKPAGRGYKLTPSAVKEAALALDIPVFQPEKLKNPEFLEALKALQADLFVIVAFRMLPEVVWNMPPLGSYNLHASLLPAYRGAAPINWAIINGENETGVSTFKLQHEIDTGDIFLQEKVAIDPEDNFGTLYNKLKIIGAGLMVKTIEGIKNNSIRPIPQQIQTQDGNPKLAPKLSKELGALDFNQPAEKLHNLIRGLTPIIGGFFQHKGKLVKVYKTSIAPSNVNLSVGESISDGKEFISIQTTDGLLNLLELQLEGKKRMSVKEFLIGNTW